MMYLWLLLGLALLILAGDYLVKGAVGLSVAMKVTPLVIGMTVVSFGTSAPELLVSANSALMGNPGIAIGNVIGSNIANIALVLGVTVLILPIIAGSQTKKMDYPVMLVSSFLFYLFALDNVIERWEGVVLFLILIVFISYLIIDSRKKEKRKKNDSIKDGTDEAFIKENHLPLWKSMTFLLVGLVGLYFGAEWFVDGAVGIARSFNLSDSVIGVTVVALGTSAPELVASSVAALRKQSDISVGNLIGSNIFNVFAVIGITSIITPIAVTNEVLHYDMFWMLGVALLLVPVLFLGKRIGRIKGFILLSTYLLYILLIILKTKGLI